MNVRLLRRIQKQILKEPRQFEMWGYFPLTLDTTEKIPNCGTAACIAGWSICLTEKINPAVARDKSNRWNVWRRAKKALGIKEMQANSLFYDDNWPDNFKDGFKNSNTARKKARIAAKRIDHFISTNGEE